MHRSMRVTSMIVLGLLLALVVVGCGGSQDAPTPTTAARTLAPTATVGGQPTAAPAPTTPAPRVPAGTLVVAYGDVGAVILDPINLLGQSDYNYGAAMFDKTLWFNKAGSQGPGVAAKMEMGADGRSWTISIRQDMRFHNGEPVTAEDLRFDFQRQTAPEFTSADAAKWKAYLDTVTAVDATTVVVRLKEPWPTMRGITVYPKAPFDQSPDGKAFRDNPIGSGPFKFRSQEVGVRIRLEAAGTKHAYRPQPDFQTLELTAVGEESTRLAMLRTGAADFIDISPEGAFSASAEARSGISVLRIDGIRQVLFRLFGLGNEEGIKAFPMADVRVREALLIAIDRQEIIDSLLRGFGTMSARDHVTGVTEGFDPSWKALSYNPTRAKQLLAEAGHSGGFKVKIYSSAIPGAPWTVSATPVIAGYWDRIGVQSEIVPIEYSAVSALAREVPQKKVLGAYWWDYTNPHFGSWSVLTSSFKTGGPRHLIKDPQVDALLDRADSTLDAQERIQIVRRVVEIVSNTYVSAPIAETPALYLVSSKVAGWDPIKLGGPAYSFETVKRR